MTALRDAEHIAPGHLAAPEAPPRWGGLGGSGGRSRPKANVATPRFDRAVFAWVRRIPAGRVATYGQLAALAGAPRAARAVGGAMRRCPSGIPWHRVVNGQGAISRRDNVEGMMRQRLMLESEGVRFVRGRIKLERHRWRSARDRVRGEARVPPP